VLTELRKQMSQVGARGSTSQEVYATIETSDYQELEMSRR